MKIKSNRGTLSQATEEENKILRAELEIARDNLLDLVIQYTNTKQNLAQFINTNYLVLSPPHATALTQLYHSM